MIDCPSRGRREKPAARVEVFLAGDLPCAAWQKMLEDSGFVDVEIGKPVDTFKGAGGEEKARKFEVFGYAFLARKPG